MRNGGKLHCWVCLATPAIEMDTIILKGLTCRALWPQDVRNLVQDGGYGAIRLNLEPLITHRFHYTEYEKAFEIMQTGNSGKIILDWGRKNNACNGYICSAAQ